MTAPQGSPPGVPPPGGTAAYSVRLEDVNFEGPLDLLLFLIKKNEIDIADIPIALVTEQFLAYLERITREGLEGAGDFLLMAATLMRIKSQLLLPPLEGEEEIEDPRRELVDRLLEYQAFKEVAQHLREQEAWARTLYARGARELEELGAPEGGARPDPAGERKVTLKDLLRAFADVLASRREEPVHHVDVVRITLEEKVREVREALAARGRLAFGELFAPGAPRIELVVTLIALLEMVRNREVRLRQRETFGEIEVVAARATPAGRPEPSGAGEPRVASGTARGRPEGGAGEGPWSPR